MQQDIDERRAALEKVAIPYAEAEEKEAKAEAKAKAEAEAEANRKIAESLTDSLINYAYVNNWDGKLPTYMGSGNESILMPIE